MSAKDFILATAPILRGKPISTTITDWPSAKPYPVLVGDPSVPLSRYSLDVSFSGTSGKFGGAMTYVWHDEDVDPTYDILFGKHDPDDRWDGESPFYLGFGLSIFIESGIDFSTGSPAFKWTFAGSYALPKDWTSIDLTADEGSRSPIVAIEGFERREIARSLKNGTLRFVSPKGGLVLGFREKMIDGEIAGPLTLAKLSRSPIAFMPEFDASTILSIPFLRTKVPEIGPVPRGRTPGTVPVSTYFGGEWQASSLRGTPKFAPEVLDIATDVARRSHFHNAPGTKLEAAATNEISVSSPYDGDKGGWTEPSGSGHVVGVANQVADLPEEWAFGFLYWYRGSNSQSLTKTWTGIGAANDIWAFSAFVRFRGILGTTGLTLTISGTGTNAIFATAVSGDEWIHVRVWAKQADANVTVTWDLATEGDVIQICGMQLEKTGEYGEGAPTTLIPKNVSSGDARVADQPKYPSPWYGSQGTMVVVFRYELRGGIVTGINGPRVPLVAGWDYTSGSIKTVLGYLSSNGSTGWKAAFVYDGGTINLLQTSSESLVERSIGHIVLTWEPVAAAGGETATRVKIYHAGDLVLTSSDLVSFPSMLGDEIIVAPSAGLPSVSGYEMSPFSGDLLLVRYDSRVWGATEISDHNRVWRGIDRQTDFDTGDELFGDLLILSQGRRFSMRASHNHVPGNEKFQFLELALAEREAHPRQISRNLEFWQDQS